MISVCMATYNGAAFILPQLDSVLAQLGPGDEVVICDDGSTDGTVGVIESFGDPRIRLTVNPHHLGYCANFERCLGLARGELVFLCDDDDVWLEGKVEAMVEALKKRPLAISDAVVVNENLRPIYASHFRARKVIHGFWGTLLRSRYMGSCMALRRSLLSRALPFPPRTALYAHDYWLALVAHASGGVAVLRQGLVLHRIHGGNATTGGEGHPNPIWKRVWIRIYCLAYLGMRSLRPLGASS